jgi:GLPGLI family protein
MKRIGIILIFLAAGIARAQAQDLFVKQAKITYDKKIRPKKELTGGAIGELGESIASGGNTSWSLVFNGSTSLYKSIPINDQAGMFREMMNRNLKDEVYCDYEKNVRIKKKVIGKEASLLEDTIPHLDWKLLPEVREIAGYECRKALARINDTVYVVAFYADRILLKGGPEGFNGLPGMILGLAIPRYRMTWFASKVELGPFDPKDLQLPQGKKKDLEALAADIAKSSVGAFSLGRPVQEIKNELTGFTL